MTEKIVITSKAMDLSANVIENRRIVGFTLDNPIKTSKYCYGGFSENSGKLVIYNMKENESYSDPDDVVITMPLMNSRVIP